MLGGSVALAARERGLAKWVVGAGRRPGPLEFALDLVSGTSEALEEIDRLLSRVVEHWKLDRVAAMDRAILRLAAYELKARED